MLKGPDENRPPSRQVRPIPGVVDTLIEVLHAVLDSLEKDLHMLPDEKFALIRVIPCLLVLMDGDPNPKGSPRKGLGASSQDLSSDLAHFNAFRDKRVRLAVAQRFLRRYPVVPLYADIAWSWAEMLPRAAHYEHETMDQVFGRVPDERAKGLYNLTSEWWLFTTLCLFVIFHSFPPFSTFCTLFLSSL